MKPVEDLHIDCMRDYLDRVATAEDPVGSEEESVGHDHEA
jgi:hypothetical protein